MSEYNYEEAITSFKKVDDIFLYEAKLKLIECYCLLKEDELLVQERDAFILVKPPKLYQQLASYFLLKRESNLFEVKEFVTKELLPSLKRNQFHDYFHLVKEDLILFHRSNSRYKAVDELRSQY